MSDDNNGINRNDNGSCIEAMESLINLGNEISVTSDQIRKAVERVQDNFNLTGGLLVEGKEGIVYQGIYWNWLITSNRLFIEEDHEISSMDRIPREVIIRLIRVLPDFLRHVEYQYLDLKKALRKAKCDLEATNSVFGEVCFGRKSGRR